MLLKRSQFLALAAGALVTPLVASCGKSAAPSGPVDVSPEGEIKPREISWLLSRPANGAVIETEQLRLWIADDGVGGASLAKGHGLAGLVERLEGVDGRLTVTSPAGGPTRVEAVIPCAS